MAYSMPTKDSKVFSQGSSTNKPTVKARCCSKPWLKSLITLIVVLIILGGGIYLLSSYTGIGSGLLSTSVSQTEWQAVFLTNGQVYFGKIIKMDNDFITLENIYYLQVIDTETTIGQPPDVQVQPEQRLTLIKLGNEIHGPKDTMKINREHVVIIEDLGDDSRVVQAINENLSAGSVE